MKSANSRSTCGCAAWLLAGLASAAEPVADVAAPEPPAGRVAKAAAPELALAHKLRLTKQQLTQSPSVKRILQGDHAEAKAKLAQAQVLYEAAEHEAHISHFEAAGKLVDESLGLIMIAAKLAPDAALLAAQERRQNTELREAIRTFHLLHKNLTNRLGAIKAPTPAVDTEIAHLDAMTGRAEALIASGNQHEAHLILKSAHLLVVSTLNKMLMSETIVYDLKFESPQEEFQHELARNMGLEELIPLALAQVKVSHETAALADRYVQQSRELRTNAQQQFHSRNYPAALKSIQEASAQLQYSLRLAGVVVSQSPEITR
jgi:hypothetical protein